MADAIFDGDNLYITLPSIGSFDIRLTSIARGKSGLVQGITLSTPQLLTLLVAIT